jgi:hypothetical protein
MKKLINNREVMILAGIVFACVLSWGTTAIADESEAVPDTAAQEQPLNTDSPGEIGDLARRAEKQIKEVNDAFNLEKKKLETEKREQYFEDNKVEPSGSLLSKEDIAALEKKQNQEENAIRAKTGSVIESLEAGESAAQPASYVAAAPRYSSQPAVRGMVKGIVFYENKGAALISGEVVREGDDVLGVKVTKILPDFVEFEKQGSQWKQQVGQVPSPGTWEQPQPQPAKQPSANPKTKK